MKKGGLLESHHDEGKEDDEGDCDKSRARDEPILEFYLNRINDLPEILPIIGSNNGSSSRTEPSITPRLTAAAHERVHMGRRKVKVDMDQHHHAKRLSPVAVSGHPFPLPYRNSAGSK